MGISSCKVAHNPLHEDVMKMVHSDPATDVSYIYALPYREGKTYRVVQGYYSWFTHRDRAALDFNMHRGSEITAARDGVVIRVKEDGDKGGLKKKFRAFGNNIVIEHNDGSRAGYWHLQKNGALVNLGDTVKKGQLIALSGETGYAAFPHLHFLVWKNGGKGNWQPVATRFQTTSGVRYLKFFGKYKNGPSKK